jgi:hypothetical protein
MTTTISKDEFLNRLSEGLARRLQKFSRHLDIQGHGDLQLDDNAWLRTYEAWSSQSSLERDLAMEVRAFLMGLPVSENNNSKGSKT